MQSLIMSPDGLSSSLFLYLQFMQTTFRPILALPRKDQFAVVSAAVALEMDGARIRQARIALGGVGTKPWRVSNVEAALSRASLDPAALRRSAFVRQGRAPSASIAQTRCRAAPSCGCRGRSSLPEILHLIRVQDAEFLAELSDVIAREANAGPHAKNAGQVWPARHQSRPEAKGTYGSG
jgi:hypothetical protein